MKRAARAALRAESLALFALALARRDAARALIHFGAFRALKKVENGA